MGKNLSFPYSTKIKGFQEKKQLTLHKMCVTSLLCGPWADFRPFYGLYGMGFLSHKKADEKAINRPMNHAGET